jgi:hypothetical protein
MNTATTTVKWTSDDERMLNELTERRQAIYDKAKADLSEYLAGTGLQDNGISAYLSGNATEIRKLLKPFDLSTNK